MPVFETFSKRQKRLRGDVPDVYSYDEIPTPLRVQIVQIMHDILGDETAYADDYGVGPNVRASYRIIVEILRRELGVFTLPPAQRVRGYEYLNELTNFMLGADAEDFLSAVELVGRFISRNASSHDYRRHSNAKAVADGAIEEINTRFKEHGVGYEFDDGIILRIDDQFIHAEAVKPALLVLRNPRFKGAEDEFLKAFEDYRKGDNKGALTEALKAFESTMKSIFDKRGWTYQPTDTAKKLVAVCFEKGLIPAFYESHFAGLRAVLEGGVPTPRNKLGGHGQGAELTTVPDHLASYALHMTAATILFLVKADEALQ